MIAEFLRSRRGRGQADVIAAELDVPQRVLLFCLASNTNVAKDGVSNATVRSRQIVRGLIERQGWRFVITDQGRAVLTALIEGQ